MAITIKVKNAANTIAGLQRLSAEFVAATQRGVQRGGDAVKTILIDATPIGRGENPGNMRRSYVMDYVKSSNGATAKITNTAPYQQWVLAGRGPVRAVNGKYLRFVINGRVFYRTSVRAAKANPFDERVEPQMTAAAQNAIDTEIAKVK